MRGSRSQTPTISHCFILWICEACESAIFPHPTIATLSIASLGSACFEIAAQSLGRRNLGRPPYARLQFLVAVASLFPERAPSSAIKGRRQLPLRPAGVSFPQITQPVTHSVGNIERLEVLHIALVQAQELPTGRQIVIHHVEDLAVDILFQSGQGNRFSTIVDIRKWDWV